MGEHDGWQPIALRGAEELAACTRCGCEDLGGYDETGATCQACGKHIEREELTECL